LCAFLGPEPIHEDLFTTVAEKLPRKLAARARDPLAWRQTLAAARGLAADLRALGEAEDQA
jgi:hypothetical protein